MGKIFYIMGKSSSGKDTVYKKLLKNKQLQLKSIVLYTTRPARAGEIHGREYFFSDEQQLQEIEANGKLIEMRAYDTIHGVWKYFTADDGQIDLQQYDYLVIGTLVSYERMRTYFGAEKLVPIYLEVDDGMRLLRAVTRERDQKEPKYAELCRRYLADEQDFSEANLDAAGISRRFGNNDLPVCLAAVRDYITNVIKMVN